MWGPDLFKPQSTLLSMPHIWCNLSKQAQVNYFDNS